MLLYSSIHHRLSSVEVTILSHLRHTIEARFSDLQHANHMKSADFKYYLRNLASQGLIRKNNFGRYELTNTGKEFANNLDSERRMQQKQPKLSVQIILKRDDGNATEYLIQKRLRHPFLGYYSFITGPVPWGEDLIETGKRELCKQTGLATDLSVGLFYRKRDFVNDSNELLEDKLFAVLYGNMVKISGFRHPN